MCSSDLELDEMLREADTAHGENVDEQKFKAMMRCGRAELGVQRLVDTVQLVKEQCEIGRASCRERV